MLIAAGIFMYTAMGAAAGALDAAAQKYYKNNRLADVFATAVNVPGSELSALERIDGINELQARLTCEARVPVSGNSKIIWLRLISFDTDYEGVSLNYPDINGLPLEKQNDIWLNHQFAEIHNLQIGDKLSVIIDGRFVELNIVGLANSPEYVYALRDATEIYPDRETFGIGYINIRDLAQLLNSPNMYNDLSFSLENGFTFDEVKQQIETVLEPFGMTGLYEAADQMSYTMVDAEVTNVKAMSGTMPLLFSGIAAIVLFMMLKRIIEQERTQIGTLKTFGYTNREILLHYILYGLFTGLIGGIVGVGLGNLSVEYIIRLYTEFFTLPDISNTIPPQLALQGIAIATISGIIGAYFGARPAVKLNPAEAMRPPSPPEIKGDILKYLPFVRVLLTSRGSMSIRNIQRTKARSLFIAVGIMFSFGILAVMSPLMIMMTDIIMAKYQYIEVFDAKLSLKQPVAAADAAAQAMKLSGVTMAEFVRETPVELRNGNLKTGTVLMGIKPGSYLYNIYDDDKKIYLPVPDKGIILNSFTADDLNARPGSKVMLTSPFDDEEIPIYVQDIIHQNMTSYAYIDYDLLHEIFNQPKLATAVMVMTNDMESLKSKLDETKNVSTITDTYTSAENFMEMMNSYSSMLWIMLILGSAIAFAIIYNSSTISLSEKKREYATLRVLGLHIKEVCEISNFEYWLLYALGCLLGVPFANLLLSGLNTMLAQEMNGLSIPARIPLWAFGAAAAGCMAAMILSNLSSKKTIGKLDMVDVLKERE
jgi:putative ABC transport system permease protein